MSACGDTALNIYALLGKHATLILSLITQSKNWTELEFRIFADISKNIIMTA